MTTDPLVMPYVEKSLYDNIHKALVAHKEMTQRDALTAQTEQGLRDIQVKVLGVVAQELLATN